MISLLLVDFLFQSLNFSIIIEQSFFVVHFSHLQVLDAGLLGPIHFLIEDNDLFVVLDGKTVVAYSVFSLILLT